MTDRVPFVPTIHAKESEISWIAESSFVINPPKGLVFSGAAIGDQTIMLGLFTDYHGGEINVPVGRFGNLAALPNSKAPIRLSSDDPFVRPAFLNDIRSRAGFSGSPVWAWYSLYDDVKISISGGIYLGDEPRRHALLSFIGVHRGQFLDPPAPLDTGGSAEVESSMTVVVPAWEISKLLDTQKLSDQRAERDKREDRLARHKSIARLYRSQEAG